MRPFERRDRSRTSTGSPRQAKIAGPTVEEKWDNTDISLRAVATMTRRMQRCGVTAPTSRRDEFPRVGFSAVRSLSQDLFIGTWPLAGEVRLNNGIPSGGGLWPPESVTEGRLYWKDAG